ncbi:Retrovirus-related Pol polyprotein from transposon TNT 1-94 [Quillaja saponaria]|uniref:Retrovirus-related Pol polyprotein from transposon TNT 1-94 n=1 Tax=Quillaja saponaria TaxID=32244 RepID=A0AAD7Q6W2_QUISA|nr:Retrovirus-related Pol polyprotein from transposon TNT 1-94 [Quillaja saponaria]
MVHVQTKLKNKEIPIPYSFVVHHSLNSLPLDFSQIKTAYNTQNESWTINDLISKCVAEEDKIKKEKSETALFVSHSKPSFTKGGQGKSKSTHHKKTQDAKGHGTGQKSVVDGPKAAIKKDITCFFCKKRGHVKADYFKLKSRLEKKDKQEGNSLAFVCFESNLVNVPSNSWWLHSGANVYVACTMQGFKHKRKPSDLEAKLRVGNDVEVEVESVGIVSLILESGFELVLKNTFYVPSFRRNLISVSLLDKIGYSFNFGNSKVQLLLNSKILGRSLIKEKSSMLWHKRLGHISRERVERLIKDGTPPSLDFDDLETCVDCIRGKLTKTKKKGSTHSSELLEIIHTDISGPYSNTLCKNCYFITFIDDFSHFGFLYLIKEKSDSLDIFIIFKTKVEKQLGKFIKIVRSDREGEYYGKHGVDGQHIGPFAKYLQECEIVAQYTMPGSPEQNGEAIKTTLYILNRVPSKAVPKTPFELWTGRKPSLNHFRVWGCPAEVRIYNPNERKTDPKSTRCYFIGYPDHSKGYRFYCPAQGANVVESQTVKFLEFDVAELEKSSLLDQGERNEDVTIPLYDLSEATVSVPVVRTCDGGEVNEQAEGAPPVPIDATAHVPNEAPQQ